MYWPDDIENPQGLLRREKTFPPPARAPELDYSAWNPWNGNGTWMDSGSDNMDVNVCYNTLCGNFGLPHTKARERGSPYVLRKRGNQMIFTCSECGLARRMYNNEAVSKLFLHVLKNNLPHEYCKDDTCENHRVNLHEYFLPADKYAVVSPAPTNTDGFNHYKYLVVCAACSKRFAAGVPWRLHGKQNRDYVSGKVSRRPLQVSAQVFMKLVCNGVGPSAMMELTECNAGDYYAMLHNLARTCNVVSGRYLMGLLSKRYRQRVNESGDTLRLYSDMMEISIQLGDRRGRSHRMPCLITVTDYRGSFFALAVTPMFMPVSLSGKDMKSFRKTLRDESLYLEAHRPHAHLLSDEAQTDSGERPGSRGYTFPLLGLGGYFVNSSYGTMAHFLALRKMLSGINRVVHYIDNENPLGTTVLTAFADRIAAGQCDVVVVALDKKKSKRPPRAHSSTDGPERERDPAPEGAEAAIQDNGDAEVPEAPEDPEDPEVPEAQEDKTLKARRKRQLLDTVSARFPQDLAEAETRQAAVRLGKDTLLDARLVLNRTRKALGLPVHIFAETTKDRNADLLAGLPEQVRSAVEELVKRAGEAAALVRETAAMVREVNELTDAAEDLRGAADGLVEAVAEHTGRALERPAPRHPPNDLAYIYRLAIHTTPGQSGLNLWVKDIHAPAFEMNRRFLWLTRRPAAQDPPGEEALRQQHEHEAMLYLYGAHQPVDTYMSSLRQLASTADRTRLVASADYSTGHVSGPRLPTSIISEFALHRFRWNFMRRRREKKRLRNNTRARRLGLDVPGPLTVNNAATERTKVFEWAQAITDSLRRTGDGEARG